MGKPLGVGVVGLGKISDQYFTTIGRREELEIVAVADLDEERARSVASRLGVSALSVDDLMASSAIDVVLNLTVPAAHAEVSLQAVRAGKSVFVEKPLALKTDDGKQLLREAELAGVRVGCAPDTVLGTGVQTAIDVLDRGEIGEVVGASAVWSAPGHELWHPSPLFYYQPGAGPLLDMGPYYITALVAMLGPVARIVGHTSRSERNRHVATGPLAGTEVPVDVETHINAILIHESGVSSNVTMSFDVWATRMSGFEVYGTQGTIALPRPFQFSEKLDIFRAGSDEWEVVDDRAGYKNGGRGIGLAEMADAIEADRPHLASGDLALHVLDVMNSVLDAGRSGSVIEMHTRLDRPQPAAWSASGRAADAITL
ncbi:Gfo/Idh/MocA family oxidoreductase [Microbacterium marmarense]|uniref:Gfo/Idh/MocA family oxidoreductase n=1 Tax=Microbacterium marmarense TaxID=3122051 RepID=A0ABU8LS07_9MICO